MVEWARHDGCDDGLDATAHDAVEKAERAAGVSGPFVAGVVAGYGVALPVGAIATYLVGLGARERIRTAAAAAFGVATTDGVFALLAVLGGVGLQRGFERASEAIGIAAAAVLVALAASTLWTAVRRSRAGSVQSIDRPALSFRRAYLSLCALTVLNPSTIGYFVALVIAGETAQGRHSIPMACLFAVGVFLASASWQLVLVASGAVLGRAMIGSRAQLLVAVISSAIMLFFAGRIVLGLLAGAN